MTDDSTRDGERTGDSTDETTGDSTVETMADSVNEIMEDSTTERVETASEGPGSDGAETATGNDETEAETETDEIETVTQTAESRTATRRGFVRAVGATAAAGAVAAAGSDRAGAQAETYRFGGEVAGWQGRSPSGIEGSTNPTIQLQAGNEYEFWFENLDGQPHNMTIQDEAGNAVAQSELISNQGGTGSVTFTATSSMAQYICTIHPTTMVGDLEVTGEAEGGGQGGSLPVGPLLMVGAIVLAFVSPLLFALFLFSRRREGGETSAR